MNLLTTKELAEALNVNPQTVRRLVNSGRIPHIELSKTEWRFDLQKVLRALHG